jgi:hypothetical protein
MKHARAVVKGAADFADRAHSLGFAPSPGQNAKAICGIRAIRGFPCKVPA